MISKSESLVSDPNKELPYCNIKYFSIPINELSACLIRFKASCFNKARLKKKSGLNSYLDTCVSSYYYFNIPPV